MPIDKQKLEAILADPDFMELPENEQESFLDEMSGGVSAQSNLIQEAASFVSQPFEAIIQPGQKIGEAIGRGYMDMRGKVQGAAASMTPDGPSVPVSIPNPLFPFSPQANIPGGSYTPKEVVAELAGMATDELATAGLAKAPKVLGLLGKLGDKGITSLMRRIGGLTSSDIKNTRSLATKYGKEFVFSKGKAKPEFIGRELAPKATDVASGRVRTMEPEALREIGVSSEANDVAQRLKGKFGLQELPSEGEADQFFAKVVNAAPDDAMIQPSSFVQVLQDKKMADKFHPGDIKYFRSMTESKPSLTESLFKGSGTVEKGLTKEEFLNLRSYVNRLTQAGDNPFAQALKTALDTDAEVAIPQLAEAKGFFQLSRELPKAQRYLDKVDLGKTMQGTLERASQPKNTQLRESLGRLLGEEASPMIDQLESQRLAKEYYDQNSLPMLPGSPKAGLLQYARRTAPRAYEGTRAGLKELLFGKSNTPGPFAKPSAPTTPLNVQAVTRRTPEIAPDYDEIARNASQYSTPMTQADPLAAQAAQEAAIRAQVAQGQLPYRGGSGRIGAYPEFIPQEPPMNPIPYAGGAGQGSFPDVMSQANRPPYPVPYQSPSTGVRIEGYGPSVQPNQPYPGVPYQPQPKPTMRDIVKKRPKPKGKKK